MGIVDLTFEEQSILMDLEIFTGEHWFQFQSWLRANDHMEVSEEVFNKLMEKFQGS